MTDIPREWEWSTVKDFVNDRGAWNTGVLEPYLNHDIIMELISTEPPKLSGEKDTLSWKLTSNGEFSIASAYKKLTGQQETNNKIWNTIWKWKGPERVRTFMWLTIHEYKKAFMKRSLFNENKKPIIRNSSWIPPQQGWVKLNTDGASQEWTSKAGCGGLLRSSKGEWIGGFRVNLGMCNAVQAELQGVLHGLRMAADLGMRRMVVEVDAMEEAMGDLLQSRGKRNK
ncbi:hypothetical protein AHAS_Ahas03G0146600 [Arachis hypogaea]